MGEKQLLKATAIVRDVKTTSKRHSARVLVQDKSLTAYRNKQVIVRIALKGRVKRNKKKKKRR